MVWIFLFKHSLVVCGNILVTAPNVGERWCLQMVAIEIEYELDFYKW